MRLESLTATSVPLEGRTATALLVLCGRRAELDVGGMVAAVRQSFFTSSKLPSKFKTSLLDTRDVPLPTISTSSFLSTPAAQTLLEPYSITP